MNMRDTESVAALLMRCGHVPAESEEDAEIVIVNTCSVRGKAEEKALGKLGLLVATKREWPGRLLGAIGCMVQRLGPSILEQVPGLDFAIGTHRLTRLPEVLELVARNGGPLLDTAESCDDAESVATHIPGRITAFVTILRGCNRRCSYCIVPAVRGPEWSRPAQDILNEIETLAAQGVREITLLGQSVMSYGRSNPVWAEGAASACGFTEPFPRLLEAVSAIPGIMRIRFTSGHPSGCSPELARAMAELPPVCEHLHLPLQSGSDRILRLMRRGYTRDAYRRAVERLRKAVPDLALATDVIVGFPSETAEDFELTRQFCDLIGFDNAFVFKYSPRPGTEAAEWPDDVPPAEKLSRNKIMLADQDRRSLAINQKLVGQTLEVLADGPSLRNKTRWSGRTRGNKIVIFEVGPNIKAGDLVKVKIERARPQTLYGSIIP